MRAFPNDLCLPKGVSCVFDEVITDDSLGMTSSLDLFGLLFFSFSCSFFILAIIAC